MGRCPLWIPPQQTGAMPLAGSIAPFVVSSPFRGLRVVPCKLYFNEYKTSKLDAGTLAIVFNDHFERSNDNPGLEKRRQFALNWYNRL